MRSQSPGRDRMPQRVATIYQEGIAAFEAQRYADAISLLGSIADEHSLSGTLARFYLAQAHLKHGLNELRARRHRSAAHHLNAARELNPDSTGLSRHVAASYAGQGRFDLAAAELERVPNDEDPARVIRLAHAFARDGQPLRAVETLVQLIDKEPHRIDVRIQLGLIYGAAEQFEDAVCVLQEASELAPMDAVIRRHLGVALGAAGDYEEAVEQLAIGHRLRPDDAATALLLTLAVEAAGHDCQIFPIDETVAAARDEDDQSIEALGELITQEPEFVEAFLNLPRSGVDVEVFALLSAIIERALEKHPDYADLHYHCSRVYQRLGLDEAAMLEIDKAIAINPRYVQALIQLGRLCAQGNRSQEACDRLQEAIACGGDYPDVHFMLGELHRKRGDRTAAIRAYDRALELNAGYTAAHDALEAVTNG